CRRRPHPFPHRPRASAPSAGHRCEPGGPPPRPTYAAFAPPNTGCRWSGSPRTVSAPRRY
ncbi:MAG: hypothetical protein AVDCRST_MAG77-4515, partial [uncultured Chloroflexi bacterium]